MYEQIISIFSSSEILATVSNNIDDLATIIDGYLSGANNLRIASIILMLLAFILFLFLVIIIYVKSIVSFLKSDNKNTEKDDQYLPRDVSLRDENQRGGAENGSEQVIILRIPGQ